MAIKSSKPGYLSKQRDSANRKPKNVIYLATEGNNKTETLYFEAMRKDSDYVIKFASGNFTDPVQMFNSLKNVCEHEELDFEYGDHAYCLIDGDLQAVKEQQIRDAERMSENTGIELMVSNPCFEVWYLCHKEYSTRKYSSSENVVRVCGKQYPGYTKQATGMYDKTKNSIDNALHNAEKLEKYCMQNGIKLHSKDFAPSTEVYRLVRVLLKK